MKFLFSSLSCLDRCKKMHLSTALQSLLLANVALALHLPRQANSSYSLKTPPLDTPWTSEVGTNPWPQYPRPLLERSQWQTLNGVWGYQKASSLDDVGNPPVGQTLGRSVLVPSCLESGISGKYKELRKGREGFAESDCRYPRLRDVLQLVFNIFHSTL